MFLGIAISLAKPWPVSTGGLVEDGLLLTDGTALLLTDGTGLLLLAA